MSNASDDPSEVIGPVENRALLTNIVKLREVGFQILPVSYIVNILFQAGLDN